MYGGMTSHSLETIFTYTVPTLSESSALCTRGTHSGLEANLQEVETSING